MSMGTNFYSQSLYWWADNYFTRLIVIPSLEAQEAKKMEQLIVFVFYESVFVVCVLDYLQRVSHIPKIGQERAL
jgi:hypothetical protein